MDFDATDSVGDQSAYEVGNAVSEIPGGLSMTVRGIERGLIRSRTVRVVLLVYRTCQ